MARILFTALPDPEFQECDPVLHQPLGSGHLVTGLEVEQIEQQKRQLRFSSSLPPCPCLFLPSSGVRTETAESTEPSSPSAELEALPWHSQGFFWCWPCWRGLFWLNKVQKGVAGHLDQYRVGKDGRGLAVPTDTPSPQSHARTAALRASMPTRSVSVMNSALTTRAAAPTT